MSKLFRFLGNNVVGLLALFVALGGTAYAANTVCSTDIVDGEVKSVDIGNNEIGSADVKDNSLNTFDVHSFLGVDVVDGTLTGADMADASSLAARSREEFVTFNDSLRPVGPRAGAVTGDEVRRQLAHRGRHQRGDAQPCRLRDHTARSAGVTTWPARSTAAGEHGHQHCSRPGNYTVAATSRPSSALCTFDGVGPAIRSVRLRGRERGRSAAVRATAGLSPKTLERASA